MTQVTAQVVIDYLERTLLAVEKLISTIKKSTAIKVSSAKEKRLVTDNVKAWFSTCREIIITGASKDELAEIDAAFLELHKLSLNRSTRSRYVDELKEIRARLHTLKGTCLPRLYALGNAPQSKCPDLTTLVPDADLRVMIEERWVEVSKCLAGDAALSSVVMMGGLLEAVLYARVLKDRVRAFASSKVPVDKNTNNKLLLDKWMLADYIDVSHDLGWITLSCAQVSAIVRDWRNYVHIQKQHRHAMLVDPKDGRLFWSIVQTIVAEVAKS